MFNLPTFNQIQLNGQREGRFVRRIRQRYITSNSPRTSPHQLEQMRATMPDVDYDDIQKMDKDLRDVLKDFE